MSVCSAFLPVDQSGPGRLAEVSLDVLQIGPAELELPEATIRDERGGALLAHGLVTDPCRGGGPLCGREQERAARAFGLVNVAFLTQLALWMAAGLLG